MEIICLGGIFMLKHTGSVSMTMLRTTHGRYLGAVFWYMGFLCRPYSCDIPVAIRRVHW